MSVQSALKFIAAYRHPPRQIDSSESGATPVTLIELQATGKAMGLEFSLAELRKAFLMDWKLRNARTNAISD